MSHTNCLLSACAFFLCSSGSLSAAGEELNWVSDGRGRLIHLRETAAIPVPPDTVYLLMRVESDAADLAGPLRETEHKLDGFTRGLLELGIPSRLCRWRASWWRNRRADPVSVSPAI